VNVLLTEADIPYDRLLKMDPAGRQPASRKYRSKGAAVYLGEQRLWHGS